MSFAKFMSSGLGRGIRIAAGLLLIALGLLSASGAFGLILIIIGAIPLIAGGFDLCVIGATFLGTPLRGDEVRAEIQD